MVNKFQTSPGLLDLDELRSHEIWIYGTGSFAKRIFEILQSFDIAVNGFLDHVKPKPLLEFPVLQLNEFEVSNNAIVIIGICNLNVDISAVEKSLLNHKIQKFINPVQFCIMLGRLNLEFSNYWLTSDLRIYETNHNNISKFREILEDEHSRLEYDGILNYRITGKTASLRKPEGLDKQYLASDLGSPPKNMRILELGAFQGEDLIRFIHNGHTIDFGILLEPDLKNFHHLILPF